MRMAVAWALSCFCILILRAQDSMTPQDPKPPEPAPRAEEKKQDDKDKPTEPKPEPPKQEPPKPEPPKKPSQTEMAKVLTVKMTKLFPDPGDLAIMETLKISDIGRVALVVKNKKGEQRVLLNGREQKPYAYVVPLSVLAAARKPGDKKNDPTATETDLSNLLRFSPDQKRVYYIANNNKGYVIASDNIDSKTPDFYESKTYDFIMEDMPLFSADSKKIAFAAQRASRSYVVVNNVEGKDYDDLQIGTVVFSPDSKRLAFCARKGGEWRVFHDTGSFQAFEGVAEGSPIFSPDSQRLGYVALKQGKWKVMVDGQEYGTYDAVAEGTASFYSSRLENALVWSPDSKHLAYAAKNKSKWLVNVDGKEFGPYDGVAEATPIYSKDSKKIVWAAQVGKEWTVYENGSPVMIPGPPPKKGEKPKTLPLVVEGVFRGTPMFSPDGKKLVVGLKRQGAWTVWVDGQESEKFDDIKEWSLKFTKDSSKILFVGVREKKFVPVINFKEMPPCLEVGPLRISRGEATGTVAFAVKREKTKAELEEERKANPKAGDLSPTYWKVVVNGEDRYGPYENMQGFAVTVAPNGARIAYPAEIKSKWGLWIDGERRTDALPIWIGFNPETNYLEMIAITDKDGYVFLQEQLE